MRCPGATRRKSTRAEREFTAVKVIKLQMSDGSRVTKREAAQHYTSVLLQELKKELQGVGHFLGVGLGSPIGIPLMCR